MREKIILPPSSTVQPRTLGRSGRQADRGGKRGTSSAKLLRETSQLLLLLHCTALGGRARRRRRRLGSWHPWRLQLVAASVGGWRCAHSRAASVQRGVIWRATPTPLARGGLDLEATPVAAAGDSGGGPSPRRAELPTSRLGWEIWPTARACRSPACAGTSRCCCGASSGRWCRWATGTWIPSCPRSSRRRWRRTPRRRATTGSRRRSRLRARRAARTRRPPRRRRSRPTILCLRRRHLPRKVAHLRRPLHRSHCRHRRRHRHHCRRRRRRRHCRLPRLTLPLRRFHRRRRRPHPRRRLKPRLPRWPRTNRAFSPVFTHHRHRRHSPRRRLPPSRRHHPLRPTHHRRRLLQLHELQLPRMSLPIRHPRQESPLHRLGTITSSRMPCRGRPRSITRPMQLVAAARTSRYRGRRPPPL